MRVDRLWLKNYRNIQDECIEFSSGFNVIYGENAQGKTNIIEAIWLLTGARSFRGSKDKNLIMFNMNYAEISGDVIFPDRPYNIKIKIENGKRLAQINNLNRGMATSIIGMFKAVIFSPEHLALVKSGPENRRKFIDAAICQLKPTYTSLLVRYNKILKQRNILLKDIIMHRELEETLEIWDKKLAEYAGQIVVNRLKYIKMLSEKAKNVYFELSGGEKFQIKYSGQDEYNIDNISEVFNKILRDVEKARAFDISRGYSSVGPHRDEIGIYIDGKPARLFASQGQQRSCVIALKLSEADIIGKITDQKPIVLLDDILSELDEKRQSYMFKNTISDQTIITGCVKPQKMPADRTFKIKDGKVV